MGKIELDRGCPDMLHDFTPIIEGGQTVGITCLNCGKTVREDMQYSGIIVTDTGVIIKKPAFQPNKKERKDPRF